MSRCPTRTGFTLLELMIVLLVIGGAMALTWPNLRKSLERNELNEAARTVRELLEEVRYQAMVSGQIGIVRLEEGLGELRFGSLAQWSNDSHFRGQLSGAATSPFASTSEADESNLGRRGQQLGLPKSLQLPEPVVVGWLDWGADPDRNSRPISNDPQIQTNSRRSGNLNLEEAEGNSGRAESIPFDQQSAEVAESSNFQDLSDRKVWWLIFLSDGSGQDVTIRLVDTGIEEGLSLLYRSGMGTVEVRR